jgi:hypothetical protein
LPRIFLSGCLDNDAAIGIGILAVEFSLNGIQLALGRGRCHAGFEARQNGERIRRTNGIDDGHRGAQKHDIVCFGKEMECGRKIIDESRNLAFLVYRASGDLRV